MMTADERVRIDLSVLAEERRPIISGRNAGKAARKEFPALRSLPKTGFLISVPRSTDVVTPSFFVGLLLDTFKTTALERPIYQYITLENGSLTTRSNLKHALATIAHSARSS